MSTQYRLVQSGKTASGSCSAGQGSSEPVAPWIYLFIYLNIKPAPLPSKSFPVHHSRITLSFNAALLLKSVIK
jgi:hypothetical protein